MKKKLLRLSKRILILTLCTTLLSGSVINRYKITANATSIAASIGAYTASEICYFIGNLIIAACGVGASVELYQNRDKVMQVGKDFIDSMNLDEVSGWLLSKVNTTGQSYVYGTEALKEIQEMEFTVIQGGGNMPENNNDNDDDGDIDADDRTKELEQMGMWATTYLVEIIEEGVKPLIEGLHNGEENFVTEIFPLNELTFDGYQMNDAGNYVVEVLYSQEYASAYTHQILYAHGSTVVNFIPFAYIDSDGSIALKYYYNNSSFSGMSIYGVCDKYEFDSGKYIGTTQNYYINNIPSGYLSASVNIPLFASYNDALSFIQTGVADNCLNKSKVYQIADWLQEDWSSSLTQLNTGIRSLNDNILIVGEAMNQALQNQLNGLGYISAIGEGIAGALPLALPDSIADPIYYPATSPVPELAPEELPWNEPISNPDSPEEEPPYDPDIGEVEVWKVIHGKDTFGLNTLFGSLILLIMILIMLLLIFLSCLAFIIMIFRIPAQTGFLPEEMIAGLDYIKTLEIPGFGMSVYAFFMSLIYILLIFTVIGILRKNIDKIKFPRKGRR